MSLSAPASALRRNGRFLVACGALLSLHLALVEYFIGFERLFSHVPLQGDDFDTHIGQTYRVIEGLSGWGRSWVYDVDLLAGNPAGVIFDADNKGWSLWTYALMRLGLSRGQAFNSFVLFGQLLPLVSVLLAGLWLGLPRWQALAGAALASVLWFFDSFCHWVWWVGMVSYGAGACLSLLPLALFYRFVEGGALRYAALCAPLLAATLLIHPYSFFVLAPPMAALYLRDVRRLPAASHAAVAGIVAVALLGNAYWLHNALRHWHYIQDSAYFGQPGLSYLVADFFNLLLNPSDTGVIGTRASFRFVGLGLAAGTLVVWRREGDRRFLPFVLALSVMFGLAYLGGYIPFAGQVQPYRHIVPLCMLSALLSGRFVGWLWERRTALRFTGPSRAVVALLAMLAFQHLAREVMYFFPRDLPEVAPLINGRPSPVGTMGYVPHLSYDMEGHADVEGDLRDAAEWIVQNIPAGSRILVEPTLLGERLAWKTEIEIMGGFRLRNIAHSHANLFRSYEPPALNPPAVRRYLRTFALGWAVTLGRRDDFDRADDALSLHHEVAGYAIYRTRFPVSVMLRGGLPHSRVRADTNRIAVVGSDPHQDVVLSYHFHEALRCAPGCKLERQPVDLDRVGLIRIPAPHPADFLIENSYDF